MEELIKKLRQLTDLIKTVRVQIPAKQSGPKLPQIPTPQQPKTPSMAPSTTKAPKIGTGTGPDSKKDPKKMAEQIQSGSMSTKTQKIMLKTAPNGQWSLEKAPDEDLEEVEKGFKSAALGLAATAAMTAAPKSAQAQQVVSPDKTQYSSVQAGSKGKATVTLNERTFGPYKVNTMLDPHSDMTGKTRIAELIHEVSFDGTKHSPEHAKAVAKEIGSHHNDVLSLNPGDTHLKAKSIYTENDENLWNRPASK